MAITHVDLTLDKPRRLRFDINALADVEQIGGHPLPQLLGVLGFSTIRLLLWAGLRHEDRRLTVERVGDIMTAYLQGGGALATLAERITDALEQSGVLGRAEGAQGNAPTTGEGATAPAAPG